MIIFFFKLNEAAGRAICYSSTKYGIRGLMDGLHDLIRMDKLNLNVTTIFPALVNTRKEFIEQFISNDGYVEIFNFTHYFLFIKDPMPIQMQYFRNATHVYVGVTRIRDSCSMIFFLTKKTTIFRLNPAAELVFYTPKQVAEAAIDGILRNKRYVVMPGCFSPLIKIIK